MPQLPTLLLLEESAEALSPWALALSESFEIQVASGNEQALAFLASNPNLVMAVLSDVTHSASGFDLLPKLRGKSELAGLPILFFSAAPSDAEHEKALTLGATDYLSKLLSVGVLKARLWAHLKAYEARRLNLSQLSEELAKKEKDLLQFQDVAVTALASMAELRDPDTVNHIHRTQHYVRTLARRLSSHPQYAGVLSISYISMLFKAAPLHDIGKSGIPDRILLKLGRLTPEETDIMRTHTTVGRDIIENAERTLGVNIPFFAIAKEIAYAHHEKWDGTGYPLGLSGEAIPVSARLMALADVYDALITRRTYKEPMGHEGAIEIIQSASGGHFDPIVVSAFLEVSDSFKTIAIAHSDGAHDYQKKADYKAIVYPSFRD